MRQTAKSKNQLKSHWNNVNITLHSLLYVLLHRGVQTSHSNARKSTTVQTMSITLHTLFLAAGTRASSSQTHKNRIQPAVKSKKTQCFERYVRGSLFRSLFGITAIAGVGSSCHMHSTREYTILSMTGVHRHGELVLLAVLLKRIFVRGEGGLRFCFSRWQRRLCHSSGDLLDYWRRKMLDCSSSSSRGGLD